MIFFSLLVLLFFSYCFVSDYLVGMGRQGFLLSKFPEKQKTNCMGVMLILFNGVKKMAKMTLKQWILKHKEDLTCQP